MKTGAFLTRAFPAVARQKLVVAIPPVRRDQMSSGTELSTSGLTLRSNFAWILTGNILYATCQLGTIVALAKLGTSFMVGQFSLGLAIAAPVLMFTNLHLRAVLATDARRLHPFAEYLNLRVLMILGGLVVISGIVYLGHYQSQTTTVILAVAFAKGIEALSDIHYGLFQLNDRLDLTGRSMMLRGILAVLTLGTAVYLIRSVLWGCVGVALAWLAVLVFFDIRHGRRIAAVSQKLARPAPYGRPRNLLRQALPLGIATTMAALNVNIPRYFIHARLGEYQLGIYSALAYTTVVMILISDSLGHSAIPRLSRCYSTGRMAEYRSLLLKLVAAGGTLGLAGLVGARFMGARLLALVYGRAYADQFRIFLVLILAAAVYCVASMLTGAITSARCFTIQVPLYALVTGSNALACASWVPKSGIAGGAAAMVVASLVHLLMGAVVIARLVWRPAKHSAGCQRPSPSWAIENPGSNI